MAFYLTSTSQGWFTLNSYFRASNKVLNLVNIVCIYYAVTRKSIQPCTKGVFEEDDGVAHPAKKCSVSLVAIFVLTCG